VLKRCGVAILVVLFLMLASATSAAAQSATAAPQAAAAPNAPAYPESAEGLTSLLEDIFTAEKAQDAAKATQLYDSLTIPDHAQWFASTFGDSEGPRLETKYSASFAEFAHRSKDQLEKAAAQGKTVVTVRAYPTGNDPSLIQAFRVAMKIPASLYHAAASSGPNDSSPIFLGDFVYASGGFRYVDFQLMQALSIAPPMRVRIAGNVQAPKLLNRVAPVYPQEARAKHIDGTVKLHVILAKDGAVREVGLISGDRMLAQAAANAVWQWKYQPTLLNGQPVEVDTEVTVIFQLAN